jgi:transposase
MERAMKLAKYRQILDENLLQSANNLRLGVNIYVPTGQCPKAYSQSNTGMASDFNPIEHLWKDVKIAVHCRSPFN